MLPAGDWYNSLQLARNNIKATTRAEQDHNRKVQEHQYQEGQQMWLDECNFLSKKRNWRQIVQGHFSSLKSEIMETSGSN